MTSWTNHPFSSPLEHDTDRQTSWAMSQRLGRQNAFIVDTTEPYNPFDSINIQLSDDSSSSSFSSIHSAVSKTLVEDSNSDTSIRQRQRHQRIFSRTPMPHNTADYDAPLLKTTVTVTTQHLFLSWLDSFYLILRKALLVLALSFIYQVFSCIELKPMPTERLYAVDPDAPTHVWVPVSLSLLSSLYFIHWFIFVCIFFILIIIVGISVDMLETCLDWEVPRIRIVDPWWHNWISLAALEATMNSNDPLFSFFFFSRTMISRKKRRVVRMALYIFYHPIYTSR
ncbi:hypothetical protein BCR42DRAFT_401283 [Absidia repens]|uniref:Uncharacterized protein n=1 Tax=Absidia repens TaxID=90262 RepID=A0A1X2J400_9FUNG|nr:hypothetical protein BCR42DRAFT_401283 [Absidia repens]